MAWLSRIVLVVISGRPAAFLRGSGLPTNPGYVQDLALWLPLTAVAAAWLWQHRPWGLPVIGEVLVMLVLESTGIAADQWYGRAADPGSPVGSAAFTPLFGALDRTFAP